MRQDVLRPWEKISPMHHANPYSQIKSHKHALLNACIVSRRLIPMLSINVVRIFGPPENRSPFKPAGGFDYRS